MSIVKEIDNWMSELSDSLKIRRLTRQSAKGATFRQKGALVARMTKLKMAA
jgi:hypothetical protein